MGWSSSISTRRFWSLDTPGGLCAGLNREGPTLIASLLNKPCSAGALTRTTRLRGIGRGLERTFANDACAGTFIPGRTVRRTTLETNFAAQDPRAITHDLQAHAWCV